MSVARVCSSSGDSAELLDAAACDPVDSEPKGEAVFIDVEVPGDGYECKDANT